jgi:hypothetical protein
LSKALSRGKVSGSATQAFKKDKIYTMKNDNILYSTIKNEYNFPV